MDKNLKKRKTAFEKEWDRINTVMDNMSHVERNLGMFRNQSQTQPPPPPPPRILSDEADLSSSSEDDEPKDSNFTAVDLQNDFHDRMVTALSGWLTVYRYGWMEEKCEYCHNKSANRRCEDCNVYLCAGCSSSLHKSKKRVFHRIWISDDQLGFILDDKPSLITCDCMENRDDYRLEVVGFSDEFESIHFKCCKIHILSELAKHGLVPGKVGPELIIAVKMDHLKWYHACSIQERSISNVGFYHALANKLNDDSMVQKYNSWYPAVISAGTLYKRALIEVENLNVVNGKSMFMDCKACDKLAADGCFATSRWDSTSNKFESNFKPHFTMPKEIVSNYLNLNQGKQGNSDRTPSDCQSTFKALQSHKKFQGMKKGKNEDLDETGQFGVFCARHGTIISLISMTTGENMHYLDMIIKDLLKNRNYNPKELHLFYDIACHYEKHVKAKKVFPDELMSKMSFIVGQFHVYAHQMSCLKDYNPKLMTHIGQTDGEAAERNWPWFRGISTVVKNMNPYRRLVTVESLALHIWKLCNERFPQEWVARMNAVLEQISDAHSMPEVTEERNVPQELLKLETFQDCEKVAQDIIMIKYLIKRKTYQISKVKQVMSTKKQESVKKLHQLIEMHNSSAAVMVNASLKINATDLLDRSYADQHKTTKQLIMAKLRREKELLELDLKNYLANSMADCHQILSLNWSREVDRSFELGPYLPKALEKLKTIERERIKVIQIRFRRLLYRKSTKWPIFKEFARMPGWAIQFEEDL